MTSIFAASVSAKWPTRDFSLAFVNLAGNCMFTDPIADMLTRIRNAAHVRKESVDIPFSSMKMAIAEILVREGYVATAVRVEEPRPTIRLRLKYRGAVSAIADVQRVSTPGHRRYVGKDSVPTVRNNYGIAILSTSRGLMTNKEAKAAGIGGEVVCTVY